MSVSIVSSNHINTLIEFARYHRVEFFYQNQWHEVFGQERGYAQMLAEANRQSYMERYHEEIPQKFQFGNSNYPRTGIEIYQMCDGYEYNACEWSGWQSSKEKALLEAIRRAAIQNTPEYRQADCWMIN